jgi:diguanylate cyclase (GGDEF)-like protein
MVAPSVSGPRQLARRSVLIAGQTLAVGTALALTLSQLPAAKAQAEVHPQLWLMAGLAAVAGALAFTDSPTGRRAPTITCPTICFTFAIQLCWGLGPAIVAQLIAVVFVARRLRRPAREAIEAATFYVLSFAASEVVLWAGDPDPFERHGPTNLWTDAISVVGAAVAWLATYALLALVSERLGDRPRPRRRVVRALADTLLFKGALLLLSPTLAVSAHINIGFVPLLFVPLFAVQRMARLSTDRDRASQVDPLTALANRTRLKLDFDDIVAGYPDDDEPEHARATLLLLDLDRFKDVNDALGHDVGDQLLVAVARRIAAIEPSQGTVARLGGDEFAILSVTRTVDEAARLAEDVVEALGRPVRLDRLRIDLTASVGIARHTDGRDGFTDLMRQADVAMYQAKRRGDAIAAYAEGGSDTDATPERLGLLADLRDALEAGDREHITMHYQPQVSLGTGDVEGVEALLRWRHPIHGPIATQDLLTVVEHSAVMQLLTTRVIDDVVAQVAQWAAEGVWLRASLNISARDLYSDDVVNRLATRLAEHRVDPGQIQVEITESALLVDPVRARATVGRIAALGVAISLDDFGTGYSSLQHLRKMPIAEIKIDRSFVVGMGDNRDDAAIVTSTVEMARLLGIRTVAEGVETECIWQLLMDTGCNIAQGWLTARPMPGSEVLGWLSQRRALDPVGT